MDKKSTTRHATSSPSKGKKVLSNVAKKIASLKKEKKQPKVFSQEEIAVRAYFISERRREMGWDGDCASDWADAEKQLREESR